LTPLAASGAITFAQLDPSAQAPWTSTTVASVEDIAMLLGIRTIQLQMNRA
jgi:hypothetical protein